MAAAVAAATREGCTGCLLSRSHGSGFIVSPVIWHSDIQVRHNVVDEDSNSIDGWFSLASQQEGCASLSPCQRTYTRKELRLTGLQQPQPQASAARWQAAAPQDTPGRDRHRPAQPSRANLPRNVVDAHG